MKTPSDIARFVQALPERQRSGTLRIWGQWFGRPMDNVHVCVSCRAEDARLILDFNEGETLTIWNPCDVAVENQVTLTFSSATRVRWEWHYYGRPKTPEHRMFIDYVAQDGRIQRSSNSIRSADEAASLSESAAQLYGM